MRVLLTELMVERYGGRIRAVAPGVEFIQLRSDGTFDGGVEQAEVGVLSTDTFPNRLYLPLMQAVPRMASLRWFHTMTVGVDDPGFRTFGERGVTLTNSAGVSAVPIAQYVLAMMLRHAKNIPAWEASQRERVWRRVPSTELTGQTVVVLGVGGIGGEVARLAKALGMRVLGTRRSRGEMPHVDGLHPPEKLHELLAEADYVVIACPLTPQTRHMIDASALAVLKPAAYLINVARGAIVDEPALIEALQQGRIGGAALDVFETEPLPPESPLWSMPNVIVTPHASSISPRTLERGARMFIDNLRRYTAGQPLQGVVDFAEVMGE